jgi:ribose 5-phosphate isomerase B
MKIAFGGDHAGVEYKAKLIEALEKLGHETKDFGPFSEDSVDYPDFAHPVSSAVEEGTSDLGVLICGSGNGVAMSANKHQGIRAALCWNTELAALAKQHNNANVICIPARFVDYSLAQEMVSTFVSTDFEGGRHGRRVDKISC